MYRLTVHVIVDVKYFVLRGATSDSVQTLEILQYLLIHSALGTAYGQAQLSFKGHAHTVLFIHILIFYH
jgi:hypothetical protein